MIHFLTIQVSNKKPLKETNEWVTSLSYIVVQGTAVKDIFFLMKGILSEMAEI
jgi:hypothetical protein